MLSFSFGEEALLIGLASSEQEVEDACRLMGSGGNGFRSAECGAHAPVVIAKNRLVMV